MPRCKSKGSASSNRKRICSTFGRARTVPSRSPGSTLMTLANPDNARYDVHPPGEAPTSIARDSPPLVSGRYDAASSSL
eukprot:scaffold189836_cov33-Tisochrysis_lutea.AAC.1